MSAGKTANRAACLFLDELGFAHPRIERVGEWELRRLVGKERRDVPRTQRRLPGVS
jgi:hypothetical protein